MLTHVAPDRLRFEPWVAARAASCGFALEPEVTRHLALHAERVLEETARLHLTSIRDPDEFLERHIGESLEGAALIPRGTIGTALDLGSGNGYPGIPVAAMHSGLKMYLTEVSLKKAAFLRSVVQQVLPDAVVLERQVQRPSDLPDLPALDTITCRALGGWERILPRLAPKLAVEGRILLWAGAAASAVASRGAWSGLALADRRPLPQRERSWIFVYYKKKSAK